MRTSTTVAQMIIRISGVILIILGILFWAGHARSLVSLHMLLGLILVLALWTLAFLGARAGVGAGFVSLAIAWGIIVLFLGLTQASLLPRSAHWVIQLLHLVVGLAAMGLGDRLAQRIKGALAPALAG